MKLLTLARDLRRRKARERSLLFAVEGVRVVEELLRSSIRIEGVVAGPQLAAAPRGAALSEAIRTRGIDLLEVSDAEFDSAAQTDTPQGVIAVAAVPELTVDQIQPAQGRPVLILDAVQDPGNVGTIVRTAAALGAAAIVAAPGTVDLWNAKVVRSSMGASFHLPVLAESWTAIASMCSQLGLTVWGADAGGTPVQRADTPEQLALVVGNEGNGLTADGRALCTSFVSLPIESAVESLNVAVATGILLYQLRQ